MLRPNEPIITCPGCATQIPRTLVACKPCWRAVPGPLKKRLGESVPGTIARARVVGEMRKWLDNRRRRIVGEASP